MNIQDLIVIGGGPSGSFASIGFLKSNNNGNITIIDRSKPGLPVHCSGLISVNGLKKLGLYKLLEKPLRIKLWINFLLKMLVIVQRYRQVA